MKKKKIIPGVVLAVLALMISLSIGYALAKYVKEQGQQSEINSDVFYFTSDYLKAEEVPEYAISGNSITFELRNYVDSLRVNESDINYTVTVETKGEGITLSETSGTLTRNIQNEKEITLSYAFIGSEMEKEITVTVESSAPYVKTLSATFIFKKSILTYEIKDEAGELFAELYIYTRDAVTVTIEWNKTEMLIDETNDYVFGNLSAEKNEVTIENIAADTTVKIIFFKKDTTQDYSCGVTEFSDSIVMPTETA